MKNRIFQLIYIFFRAIVIVLLLLLPIIKIVSWYENKSINKIKLNAGYTKGKVIRTYFSKTQQVAVMYLVSNQVFEVTSGLGFGDRLYIQYYKVMYDSTKPSDSEILTQEPLFKRTDSLDSTFANIIQIENHNFIRYEYWIGNVKYKKFQKYFDISSFKIGQKVLCFYVKESPENAILDYPNFRINQKYLWEQD